MNKLDNAINEKEQIGCHGIKYPNRCVLCKTCDFEVDGKQCLAVMELFERIPLYKGQQGY